MLTKKNVASPKKNTTSNKLKGMENRFLFSNSYKLGCNYSGDFFTDKLGF